MEVRRSKGGKACLVIGGTAIVKYVTTGGKGPILSISESKAFYKEWPKLLTTMTAQDAVVSYLCQAKRACRYDANVIKVLWEMFMNQYSNEMSLAQLVAWYNKLAASVNKPPRKSFESKAAALTAIEKLDTIIAQQTPQQEAAQTRRNTMSEKDVAEKKPRGKGIGARAKELILEGKTVAEVIETIQAEIEGANPTAATIAWYKNKLRQEGLLPPTNRKTKVAEADEEAAEEAAE